MKSTAARMSIGLILAGCLFGGCDAERRKNAQDAPTDATTGARDAADKMHKGPKGRPVGFRAQRPRTMRPSTAAETVPVVKPVDAEAVRRFAAAFRALCSGDGITPERIGKLALEHLGSNSFADIAGSLCAIMADGTAEYRMAALAVLAALRRERNDTETAEAPADATLPEDAPADAAKATSPAETADDDSAQGETDDAPIELDDVEERATMAMMTMCLADDNPDVRDSAYETLTTLPEGERTALSLQLLGNDDAVLKESLLFETRNGTDDFSLTLNFHGLDAEEKSVRDIAALNILEKTGKTFSSTEEAFEWHESRLNANSAAQTNEQTVQPVEQAAETP